MAMSQDKRKAWDKSRTHAAENLLSDMAQLSSSWEHGRKCSKVAGQLLRVLIRADFALASHAHLSSEHEARHAAGHGDGPQDSHVMSSPPGDDDSGDRLEGGPEAMPVGRGGDLAEAASSDEAAEPQQTSTATAKLEHECADIWERLGLSGEGSWQFRKALLQAAVEKAQGPLSQAMEEVQEQRGVQGLRVLEAAFNHGISFVNPFVLVGEVLQQRPELVEHFDPDSDLLFLLASLGVQSTPAGGQSGQDDDDPSGGGADHRELDQRPSDPLNQVFDMMLDPKHVSDDDISDLLGLLHRSYLPSSGKIARQACTQLEAGNWTTTSLEIALRHLAHASLVHAFVDYLRGKHLLDREGARAAFAETINAEAVEEWLQAHPEEQALFSRVTLARIATKRTVVFHPSVAPAPTRSGDYSPFASLFAPYCRDEDMAPADDAELEAWTTAVAANMVAPQKRLREEWRLFLVSRRTHLQRMLGRMLTVDAELSRVRYLTRNRPELLSTPGPLRQTYDSQAQYVARNWEEMGFFGPLAQEARGELLRLLLQPNDPAVQETLGANADGTFVARLVQQRTALMTRAIHLPWVVQLSAWVREHPEVLESPYLSPESILMAAIQLASLEHEHGAGRGSQASTMSAGPLPKRSKPSAAPQEGSHGHGSAAGPDSGVEATTTSQQGPRGGADGDGPGDVPQKTPTPVEAQEPEQDAEEPAPEARDSAHDGVADGGDESEQPGPTSISPEEMEAVEALLSFIPLEAEKEARKSDDDHGGGGVVDQADDDTSSPGIYGDGDSQPTTESDGGDDAPSALPEEDDISDGDQPL
uniref:Uncharacterized protein n=1 Tax=Neospora caninum (strain Liverpool) TaxID=572307 RepID=F0JB29_NEOCL|nr:hypothetical protein NCLIV_069520 [Neospora caninum Liverpool]CEL71295.1 TPA: hypothetical protein BN1204_069520 [Neospora caninum Liverpool]